MPNLQKKRLLIFEIFNIKKCTLCFGTEYINQSIHASVCPTHTIDPSMQCLFLRPSNHLPARPLINPSITYPFLRLQAFSSIQPTNQPTNKNNKWISKNTVFNSFYHITKLKEYLIRESFHSVNLSLVCKKCLKNILSKDENLTLRISATNFQYQI